MRLRIRGLQLVEEGNASYIWSMLYQRTWPLGGPAFSNHCIALYWVYLYGAILYNILYNISKHFTSIFPGYWTCSFQYLVLSRLYSTYSNTQTITLCKVGSSLILHISAYCCVSVKGSTAYSLSVSARHTLALYVVY